MTRARTALLLFAFLAADARAHAPGVGKAALGPTAPEIARVVPHDNGYVDLVFDGLVPGEAAEVVATELATPRLSFATLVAGEADPYVDSPSRSFRVVGIPLYFDRLLHAEVEGAAEGVDLYLGLDSNGNRRPDPGEEVCRIQDANPTRPCAVIAFDTYYWVMAHRRSGPPVDLTLRTAYMFYGYMDDGDLDSSLNVKASAPGRADAEGRFPVRVAFTGTGMGDGEHRIGRVRVSAGSQVLERTLRLVRDGSEPVQRIPLFGPVIALEPGQAYPRLPVVMPQGAEVANFLMERIGAGHVGLWVRPVGEFPGGPVLPPAPPVGDPGAYAAQQDPYVERMSSISFRGDLPALWYVTPVNYSKHRVYVKVGGAGYYDQEAGPLPELKAGSYFNPQRPGHGAFVYRSGTTPVMLWYTYNDDGSPTWYYVQGRAGSGMHSVPLYRSAWLGDRQRLYPVGTVVALPDRNGSIVMTYEIDGQTGVEILHPFLTGCPQVAGQPLDASAHWFDPARAGTGYSVQVHPGYEFIAAFIYDALGRPRFLVAERGGAFDADAGDLVLEQLQGFPPLGDHRSPTRTPVGLLQRRYENGKLAQVRVQAEFGNSVPGDWDATDAVVPLGETQGCGP